MPALVVVLPLMLMGALPASAQGKSKADIGISWARLGESDMTLPAGWVMAVTGHITDQLAIVSEVGGNYKSVTPVPTLPGSAAGVNVDVSEHSFLGGGRYAFGRNARVRPFAQTLVGISRVSGGASVSGVDISKSVTALTFQPGGGVDVQVSPRVAIRVQADYRLLTQDDLGTGWQYRVATGVVFARGGR
jgi:hypothetical protein